MTVSIIIVESRNHRDVEVIEGSVKPDPIAFARQALSLAEPGTRCEVREGNLNGGDSVVVAQLEKRA